MAYHTLDDVRGMAPQLQITPASKPSDGQVTQFIAEVEREMDAILINLGYTVPVIGLESVKLLRVIAGYGTLARVLDARALAVGNPDDQGAARAQKYYEKRMMALGDADDPFELPDAARTDEKIEKDRAEILESQVQGLTIEEFDAEHPGVTMAQVF